MLELTRCAILALCLGFATQVWPGSIEGDLTLFPKGCQSSTTGICKLGSELTYTSRRNGLVWKTNVWSSDEAQSGTTDGASIPVWAQGIIGKPYEGPYLKAAIIHDHYCYKENHVRSWREAHLMFYDAMIDSGVKSAKARVMYFAIYLAGPKWVRLVRGQRCGMNCIQTLYDLPGTSPSGVFLENSLLRSPRYRKEILRLHEEFESGMDYSIEELEQRAKSLDPTNFFYIQGDTYSPSGPNDPNLAHRL